MSVTDGQTDTAWRLRPRFHSMARQKTAVRVITSIPAPALEQCGLIIDGHRVPKQYPSAGSNRRRLITDHIQGTIFVTQRIDLLYCIYLVHLFFIIHSLNYTRQNCCFLLILIYCWISLTKTDPIHTCVAWFIALSEDKWTVQNIQVLLEHTICWRFGLVVTRWLRST